MSDPIKRDGFVICEIPPGATIRRMPRDSGYAFLLCHPERPPWLVTWDGEEVQISDLPFQPIGPLQGS